MTGETPEVIFKRENQFFLQTIEGVRVVLNKTPQGSESPLAALIQRAVEEAIPKYESDLSISSVAPVYATGEVLRYVGKACNMHARYLARERSFSPPNDEERRRHREVLTSVLLMPYLSPRSAYEIADWIIAGDALAA